MGEVARALRVVCLIPSLRRGVSAEVSSIQQTIASTSCVTRGWLCGRQIMSPREMSISSLSVMLTDIGEKASSTGPSAVSIDLTVEKNVLSVHAERSRPAHDDTIEMVASERPCGTFSRQLFLGDTLDPDGIEAEYESGVLTLRIPISERAKPRKVQIRGHDDGTDQVAISA